MQPLPNISFLIKKLTLLPETSPAISKLIPLKDGAVEFEFTADEDSSFFGNNITIQVIVGENGSGKSTLLDIMFRLVNNLGALLYRRHHRVMGYEAMYVGGLHADMEYRIYGKNGVLRCRDMVMALEYDGHKYAFGDGCRDIFPHHEEVRGDSVREIKRITSCFFYTVATNYSLQAFVAGDYAGDECYVWSKGKGEDRLIKSSGETWINTLFHKNDGYMSPINLNPFRDDGVVDMNVENHLTRSRIASLLIYLEKKRRNLPKAPGRAMREAAFVKPDSEPDEATPTYSLLNGYSLDRIDYSLNYDKVIGWFADARDGEPRGEKEERIIGAFIKACKLKDSPAGYILNSFQLTDPQEDDNSMIMWIAKLYLVCKVLIIAGKYPSYSRYKALGNVELALSDDEEGARGSKTLIKSLAKRVRDDRSHIGIKIRQTLTFLKHVKLRDADALFFDRVFTFDEYERLTPRARSRTISDIMKRLPPPIFTPKIYLKKTDEVGRESIPFTFLSSGERQFLFTTSTVIYHILNLKSVDVEAMHKYRGVNVVFDEVELCFHPEYQRRFIADFLRLVKAVDIPSDMSLNIIITTHSPFVLSDLPADHILYLKDGKPCSPATGVHGAGKLNPFAANVSDILRNGFFLKKGFIGEYAQKKIGALVTFLTSAEQNRDTYDMSLAHRLIDMVGDPLLKHQLKRLLREFYSKHPDAAPTTMLQKRERLLELEEEIKKLKKEIADAQDTDR